MPASTAGHFRLDHRSTSHILRQSQSTFLSVLLPCLLASFLLLSFRSALLAGTLTLTSLSDRHPSLLSSPPSPPSPPRRPKPISNPNPLPPPAADDFFFSASFFSSSSSASSSPPLNSSFPRFLLSSPSFPTSRILFYFPDDPAGNPPVAPAIADLSHRDAAALLYLISVLSITHTLAILGYIFVYSSALGIVFLAVAAAHLGHSISLIDALFSGVSIGLRRLSGFVFLKWSVRDALIQFLCILFLSDITDQAKLFKLFIKAKHMPFANCSGAFGPWDSELSEFLFAWMMLDNVVSVLFAVYPWVLAMDHNVRRRGRDVVTEGLYLVSLMPRQAFWIRSLETVVCGGLGRWISMVVGGRMFAGLLHSMAEVYFMVVWLVFYFAMRCKDAEMEDRNFGREDLENCLSGLRSL